MEGLLEKCLGCKTDVEISGILKDCPEETRREILGCVAVAKKIKALPAPKADSARAVMFALAKSAVEEKPAGRHLRFPILLRKAAVIVLSCSVLFYAVIASFSSVPGDILYPLKLMTEKAQFYLSYGKGRKTELRIVFSNERLNEAVRQYATGKVDPALLSEMLEEARLALASAPEMDEQQKKEFLVKFNSMINNQHDIMNHLFSEASEKNKKQLAPFTCICNKRPGMIAPMLKENKIPSSAQLSGEEQEQCDEYCECREDGICAIIEKEAEFWKRTCWKIE